MPRKTFSRRPLSTQTETAAQAAPRRAAAHDLPVFEPLEPRILLSGDIPCITAIDADNRGLVVVEVSADLSASTVNQDSVKIFTAGNDGLLGTADDADVGATVSYDADTDRITIDAQNAVATNERYGISINGDLIRATNNVRLDAEFNGFGVDTGNGVQGGSLLVYTRPADQTIGRIVTSLGEIDIRFFNDQTPLTVANFFQYADLGIYDSSFFHRSVTDFVVQGGGFDATDPSFGQVEDFPPVLNEPGISNTRGTIAMAKLGGDPNSATNEWFFNLADNSANLDSQNGGFTVFAEVIDSDSLAVMDALAALPTINATSVGGAFSDLPVLEEGVTADSLTTDDLARIIRVSALYELDVEPANQLGDDGTASQLDNPNGQGTVRVISLTGRDPGNIAAFIDVDWGRSGEIRDITVNEGFVGDIGIQVENVTEIRRFTDARPDNLRGALAFLIVEDGSISDLRLPNDMPGFDLGGVALPGGLTLPDDIDGDGRTGDRTAVFTAGSGVTKRADFRGDVSGDVIMLGGAERIDVRGDTSQTDFRIGNAGAGENTRLNINLRGSVSDTGITSDIPINQLRATEFAFLNPERHTISAPEINQLRVAGDFGVGTLTTTSGGIRTLRIGGLALQSNWSIAGEIRSFRVDELSRVNATINGDVANFRTGEVRVSNFAVAGESRTVRADDWLGGSLSVGEGVRTFRLGGAARGEFDLNAAQTGDAPRSVRIGGDASDGFLAWAGDAGNIRIDGDVTSFDLAGDGARGINAGNLEDSNINLNGPARSISIGSFTGGQQLFAGVTSRIDIDGAFDGEFSVVSANEVRIDGDADFALFQVGVLGDFTIRGDLTGTEMTWFRGAAGNDPGLDSVDNFVVTGTVRDVDIVLPTTAGSIRFAGMFNSTITVGDDETQDFETSGAGIDRSFGITSFEITGNGVANIAFDDASIVAGFVANASIADAEAGTSGSPFGIAAQAIDQVTIVEGNGTDSFDNINRSFAPFGGSFQIRLGFAAPA